jgi:hypothetical protein
MTHTDLLLYSAQLKAERDALLGALKEAREFMAASMRAWAVTLDGGDGLAALEADLVALGIRDGVGVRVQAAIAQAEGHAVHQE